MRETAEEIDFEASNWVSRIDRGLSDEEQAALGKWLSADTRRRGALTRARAVWQDLDRAQVFRIADDVRRAPERPNARSAKPAGYAAAALVLVVAGVAGWFGYHRNQVSTVVGEIRQVPLADGSRVTLDTRSQIEVKFAPSNRLVRLESGEALFEVAKDPKRPFVVEAGKIHVRAVGTAFLVRRRSDADVEVIVTKGTVDVWSGAESTGTITRLNAGSRTSSNGNTVAAAQMLTAQQIEQAVDWKSGTVNLDGRTLSAAAAEINRYNSLRIEIPDTRLAEKTLVGNVSSSDPIAFADAAAAMFGARARREGNRLILESLPAPEK